MKLSKLILIFALLGGTAAYAMGPGLKGQAFDVVTQSVDAQTAAELTAQRDAIKSLHGELRALRISGDGESAEADDIREALFTQKTALRKQVRGIVENDPALQSQLEELAVNARESRFEAIADKRETIFNEVIAVATPEQANTLQANKLELDSLFSELKAARKAGATRDDVSDLRASIRTLAVEQHSLVAEVIDANPDALDDIADDFQKGFRGGRGVRRGPGTVF